MFKKLLWVILLSLALVLPGLTKAQGPITGPTTGKLAVTPAGYDDMGDVLKQMGYSPEEIAWEDLKSVEKLKQFSAVYINCSGQNSAVATDAAASIKQYVEEGGVIYASDWADEIVAKAFPGKITPYGGSGTLGSHVGTSGKVMANVTDPGMAAVLGKSQIEINFDMPSWAVLQGTTGKTYMTGTASIIDFANLFKDMQNIDTSNIQELAKQAEKIGTSSSKSLSVPLVVAFEAGKGEVLYTSFHNEAQVTEDVAKVLNWFANRTQTSALASESRGLASGGQKAILEITDSLKKGQSKTYTFNATGKADFETVLNFGGSSLGLTIKDPSGKEVSNDTVDNPPFRKSIAGAQKGKYTMTVIARDIPNDNYPFVLTVLGPENAGDVQIAQGSTAKTNSKQAPSFIDTLKTYLIWGAVGLGALIVLIIVIVVIAVKRSKKTPPTP